KSILKLLREGRSVSSTIVKTLSSKPGKNKTIQQEFVVSFTNFAKQEVQYTLVVNDAKPEMKRYEVGRKLRLCIDESIRSEEHTSELQSRENLVCRLLLEKKKKK